MKKKEVILQKIWLDDFISTLIDIYERGADYIDIVGCPDGKQDTIELIVRQEYIREDEEDGNLTKEKLNDLLNG